MEGQAFKADGLAVGQQGLHVAILFGSCGDSASWACLGASSSCSASTSSMVSMVPWHNYSIVDSLGSLLGDMEGAAWPQQPPSLPWHPPNTQACWGKVPSLPTFHLLCSFWIIMSGCRDRGRVWVAGPRAPNPPMHSFSVPSVFLGTGPTVYFWSRQSEHSSPPRAQIIRKDAEEKEISQLAGSTGLG